ncbi:hypothetical protein [Brevibacillus choshinensis]|uniref:DUF4367 domain-containing protein n=1 Tax=Brevibacillus choshinensis TaxID=54911 RepID=A0ABX7FSI0_BRECH|nr:hypothetical protein [Brevibacillus choshinensis]QRG69137.1 hypothetical protein JNE38_08385 [Brevibacillus choshinensis]
MTEKQDLGEFQKVTDLLENAEVDGREHKDRIYKRLKFKLEAGTIHKFDAKQEEVGILMRKQKWKTITVSAVAVVVLCGAFSTTSFAQGMIQSILARFQVGNMEITQYDRELPVERPVVEKNSASVTQKEEAAVGPAPVSPDTPEHARRGVAPKKLTVEEARSALDMDFPAPGWMADYQYVNSVIHGDKMVEVQYAKGDEVISLLISTGSKNGISTTDQVKIKTISGHEVYFANGIVIWEHEGFTYEMYQMAEKDFDDETIGKIMDSLSTESK